MIRVALDEDHPVKVPPASVKATLSPLGSASSLLASQKLLHNVYCKKNLRIESNFHVYRQIQKDDWLGEPRG